MAGVTAHARPGIAATLLAAAALAACGGSGVQPNAYVKSVCTALGGWRNTIQSAGLALEDSGVSSASRPAAKLDYQRFVSALVIATRRATTNIRAAGAPSVAGGPGIARRLTRAFERATSGLAAASTQAAAIRTDTVTDFQLGASAVNSRIHSALEQIATASPGQSPRLRSAAAKEPACQLLAG